MKRPSKPTRAVVNPGNVKNITKQQISRVIDDTFPNKAPDCDLKLISADLTIALAPVRRDSIVKARRLASFLGGIQQHLRKALQSVENTPQTRFLLNGGGWRYAARDKEKGVSPGFVEAEIEEFFRLRDQFIDWLADPEITECMFGFPEPATLNDLICNSLPVIFEKHFPKEGSANSPGGRCTEFIAGILREAEIYSGTSAHEMIVKRRARAKKAGRV